MAHPDAARIDALLPQTQCTRCGYPDCMGYAQAMASGQADINRCPPGGAEGIADSANLSGVTYPLQVAPLCLATGMTLRVEGASTTYAPRVRSATLDCGHDPQFRESMNEATGVLEATIVGRAGRFSFDPEADLESSFPFLGSLLASTPVAIGYNVGDTPLEDKNVHPRDRKDPNKPRSSSGPTRSIPGATISTS